MWSVRVPLRPTALVVVAACLLLLAPAAHAARLDPFRGFAAWVDIYDLGVLRDPAAALSEMESRGIGVVYLETSNSSQETAIVRPGLVARFLETAHERGMPVVAWYLPEFRQSAKDLRRSLAAIDFRTPAGERFDGFALDIESTAVRSVRARTTRLLRMAEDIRAATGPKYPLGAIIPSPRGLELSPSVWPGFPYAELAARFDVFLPMVYFTYRTRTRAETRSYVAQSIAILRRETADPGIRIHVIGGVADRARVGQVRGFADAICGDSLFGASLYDFATTSEKLWSPLQRLGGCVAS
jgi:hypothetical protein